MATAEIRGESVRLCLIIEAGRGQLILEPANAPTTVLSCSIINLFAVVRGMRYHVASHEAECTLEREDDQIHLSLRRSGKLFDYDVPADRFEKALQLLAHDAGAAALGKKAPSSQAYVL